MEVQELGSERDRRKQRKNEVSRETCAEPQALSRARVLGEANTA